MGGEWGDYAIKTWEGGGGRRLCRLQNFEDDKGGGGLCIKIETSKFGRRKNFNSIAYLTMKSIQH